ncbi:MAG: hypothetical protein IPP74_09445 [Alphaproteobacteria bacterium]|nr:hypothetical protein [Alphaproteobacteria bacterium]
MTVLATLKHHMIRTTASCAVVLFSLAGCAGFHLDPALGHAWTLNMTPPPGEPDYQQGWVDGCTSGISGFGNQFYKNFYDWKQDPSKVNNPVYYQVWKDAYAYCRTYSMMQTNNALGNGDHPW